MNEDELKDLWKSAEEKNTPRINFEQIKKATNSWQRKLRRRIEVEVLVGVLVFIIYLSLLFFYPHGLYILPIIILCYVWQYHKLWLMYRSNTQKQDILSTKEYLDGKAKELTNFIRKSRFSYLWFLPPFVLFTYYISVSMHPRTKEFFDFEYLFAHPDLIYISLIFCGALTILTIIACEISIRISYLPSLDSVKELLKELESE